MNAEEKIRGLLKQVYDDGDVNAMWVWKGWSSYTLQNGWHYRWFGRSDERFMGKSVAEAAEYVEDVKSTREDA